MHKGLLERRKEPRLPLALPIQLAATGTSSAQPAELKDISRAGLCCTLPDAIPEMTMLKIELEMPGSKQRTSVQGVVVRCAKLRGKAPPTYEIGVFFTEASAEARLAISNFIKSQPLPPTQRT